MSQKILLGGMFSEKKYSKILLEVENDTESAFFFFFLRMWPLQKLAMLFLKLKVDSDFLKGGSEQLDDTMRAINYLFCEKMSLAPKSIHLKTVGTLPSSVNPPVCSPAGKRHCKQTRQPVFFLLSLFPSFVWRVEALTPLPRPGSRGLRSRRSLRQQR